MSDSNCRKCNAFLFADEDGQQICDDCFEVEKRKLAGTYYEPGSVEQREFVVARELAELASIVKSFDRVVIDAQNLADECKASADRCKKIIEDQKVNQAIDNLDYMMKRGDYANLFEEIGAGKHANGAKPIDVQREVDSVMGKFDALVADFKGLKI